MGQNMASQGHRIGLFGGFGSLSLEYPKFGRKGYWVRRTNQADGWIEIGNKIHGENGETYGQNQSTLGQSCIYTKGETMS